MSFDLLVKPRTQSSQDIRREGAIPAVVYGPQFSATSVMVDYLAFEKLYARAGEASLIDLSIEGGTPTKVLIQEVQRDPVKDRIIHADFRQINMNKTMHATIDVRFVGDAPAVKELGGTLVKSHETLDIKCLPKDLVSHIDVDLSVLKTFDDAIHVSDLQLPPGITVLDNPKLVVVNVAAPLTEEELKAMEESGPTSIEDVEVEKKGKKEEDGEALEGAAEAATAGSPANEKDKKEKDKKEKE